MDDESFWALIDEAVVREVGLKGGHEVAEGALSDVLVERLGADQIATFSSHADIVASRAETWDLLAACQLIDGWHSDDAFRDFRDVLILAGRAVFESAVADADSLAEKPILIRGRRDGRVSPGPIDDIARTAWARLTGNDDEDDWFDLMSTTEQESSGGERDSLRGEPWPSWNSNEYEARLPRLAALVGHR